MANMFDNLRLKALGANQPQSNDYQSIDVDTQTGYEYAIKAITAHQESKDPELSKAMNGKELAYSQPYLGKISANPDYVTRNYKGAGRELHDILKMYGDNIVLNTIINLRANQASRYCKPSRMSDKGLGFEIRLKDPNSKPNPRQQKEIRQLEEFLLHTGKGRDVTRDTLTEFVRKIIRDTYRYDQVNFEKVFSKSGTFERFVAKDPATIFIATDEDGNIIKDGPRYVQVFDGRVVEKFTPKEMAFAIRNPRTDIESAGYGYPEFEIALKQFIAQENTENFNDRFFSHGGTTRGILNIKADQTISQNALESFKREWKNSLRGVSGSWQIPVINAEDVKYVNMTPNARDLEFEKWLSYLITMISALYQVDSAEINFPNTGGATGRGGTSLNQTDPRGKNADSQAKGLLPLLEFIANTINKHIIEDLTSEYEFTFVGGDTANQLAKVQLIGEKAKIAMTVNEARAEFGLEGKIPGGDIPLAGTVIQRIGQEIQLEQIEYGKQQDRMNQLKEQTGGLPESANTPEGISFQDIQQGLAGNSANVSGRDTQGNVGKDGQSKDETNANSAGQGRPDTKRDK